MYSRIHVPLDNSDHSNASIEVAVTLASAFGATCVGSHVYAARMHDFRFKQMEYTLPEEYQDETELLRQRRIHDSLITTGLQLISDSYTDVMRYRCLEKGVPFEALMMDGKNWEEIVREVSSNRYDLVVMGALGMGAVKESLLGSVTERVVRRIRTDCLVVRRTGDKAMDGDIVVAIDGSPQSFGGLKTALALAKALGKRVEALAVYDPYLHYAVFNSIVDVLSEKASKVFRFKEQEALHEEIIDSGLATIYMSHLQVARETAAQEGVELETTLLAGKAFERLLRHIRETQPWLVVCGRIGVHSDSGMDMGSNSEQLLRLAPCNVLLGNRQYVPPIDLRADASVAWTPEAEQRMELVAPAARGIARTAVLRWATERGHSVISSGNVEDALAELLPFARITKRIGEVSAALASAERAMVDECNAEDARAVCRRCGYASSAQHPATCPVCGGEGSGFERIDAERLAAAAETERPSAEAAFDGRKLGWTMEARQLLQQLPAGYLRRRVKAIIEKSARRQRLPAITAEFAEPHVRPELDALDGRAGPHRAPLTAETGRPGMAGAFPPGDVDNGSGTRRGLSWSAEAESRLERITDGFLRSLAREQVERIAIAVLADEVEPLHVEAGIAEARARMRDLLATGGPSDPAEQGGARSPADEDAKSNGTKADLPRAGCPAGAERTAAARGCPAHNSHPVNDHADPSSPAPDDGATQNGGAPGLNEVTAGLVNSLGKRRPIAADLPATTADPKP